MNNLFQFHGPAVKKLLGWKQGDEEEKWAEKAVDSLVKKLKKKKSGQGTVEDLEFALANPGSHSKCVTIPRSLDGRLQVSHRKGLPHVIYCRVWRWPDLQSQHELKPIPECLYPYDNKDQLICINPYHYQRIESQAIPAVLPPLQPHYTPISSNDISSAMDGISPPMYGSPQSSELGSTLSNSAMDYSSFIDSPQSYSSASPSILSEDGYDPSDIEPNYTMCSEPDFWCTLSYYELNTRVGEVFKIRENIIFVDGFTDPSSSGDRICLGLLTNVNRNATIENTRKHIGRGVSFEINGGDVYLTNRSEAPIFVQSSNNNFKLNLVSNAVCRIPPGNTLCIFHFQLFVQMLKSAERKGYCNTYELTKMCLIRMSFVKGWGPDYHRQDVTSTPCWMEMQLQGPLACIDKIIGDLAPPSNAISSVS